MLHGMLLVLSAPWEIKSICSHCPEPVQVLSLVGGTVNVLRWPERQFQPAPGRPGRFDYWLNSHQVSVLMWPLTSSCMYINPPV